MLLKKSSTAPYRWKSRFFVACGHYLRYYQHDRPGAKLLGAIDLCGVCVRTLTKTRPRLDDATRTRFLGKLSRNARAPTLFLSRRNAEDDASLFIGATRHARRDDAGFRTGARERRRAPARRGRERQTTVGLNAPRDAATPPRLGRRKRRAHTARRRLASRDTAPPASSARTEIERLGAERTPLPQNRSLTLSRKSQHRGSFSAGAAV